MRLDSEKATCKIFAGLGTTDNTSLCTVLCNDDIVDSRDAQGLCEQLSIPVYGRPHEAMYV